MSDFTTFIAADDPRLEYSDYADLEFISLPQISSTPVARMSRPLESPTGYNCDNPGARLRFCTDAEKINVKLNYSDKHLPVAARNSKGIYLIDGKFSSNWNFSSKTNGKFDFDLQIPGHGLHMYEIIMPYAAPVDIIGIEVNAKAEFSKSQNRPEFRCIFYGDSVTQGFTADSIENTYPFLLSQKLNWQMINMGIAGRSSNPDDAKIISQIDADMLIVFIGVNDWQSGVKPSKYKNNLKTFVKKIRLIRNDLPIFLISPLWVPPSWKPQAAKHKLSDYRLQVFELVNELAASQIKYIDGAKLIDHNDKYFDQISVHPNTDGFKIMANRLFAHFHFNIH